VETTNPINGNDLQAVTDNLILETPANSDDASEGSVEATEDTQPETVNSEAQYQNDDVSYGDTDTYDEDVEDEHQAAQEEPALYTVKVDGETKQVDLDELTRGYSGQKYIQKGMSEVAEQRKQFDALQQQVDQERQVLYQMVQQVQTQGVPIVPEYPSEELRDSDPLGFQEQAEAYRRGMEMRQQWEQKASYLAQQEQARTQQLNNQFLEQQAMRLSEWMPDFNNAEKRSAFIQDVTTKAKKHYQLTDEQIGTVKTAEEVMILNDALKWRELQANKPAAQQKAEGARPVVKPAAKRAASAGKATKAKKATAAMKRSGGIDDVAAWLTS
jgi:hypothetical protein